MGYLWYMERMGSLLFEKKKAEKMLALEQTKLSDLVELKQGNGKTATLVQKKIEDIQYEIKRLQKEAKF